jgi:hypothetical protein
MEAGPASRGRGNGRRRPPGRRFRAVVTLSLHLHCAARRGRHVARGGPLRPASSHSGERPRSR